MSQRDLLIDVYFKRLLINGSLAEANKSREEMARLESINDWTYRY